MKKLSVLLVVALVAASLLLAGFAKNTSHEALKANSPKESNSFRVEPKEAVKAEPSTTAPLPSEAAKPVETKPTEKASENNVPPTQAPELKVTKEDAKAAALTHAGVNEADIRNYKVEVDKERNATVYEIEFYANNYEYDYIVNAETGKVVHSEVKKERDTTQAANKQSNAAEKAPTQAAAQPKVTKDEAKAAVLKHAGLNANDISRCKVELDKERNGLVYEIEFDAGKYEYEYEVSADSGKVLKHEKEFRD